MPHQDPATSTPVCAIDRAAELLSALVVGIACGLLALAVSGALP